MNEAEGPFERDQRLDKPGIVGARWWNKALQDQDREMSRRGAIGALGAITAGGAILVATGGAIVWLTEPDYDFLFRDSLSLQLAHGWDIGSFTEMLNWTNETYFVVDPTAIATLPEVLTPRSWESFQVPTLLRAPRHVPSAPLPVEVGVSKPLSLSLRRIFNAAIARSYAIGVAVGNLLATATRKPALIVDLTGPESVAFGAGISAKYDPVCLFDNFPHPRGVVPSHLTLAALLQQADRFNAMRTARNGDEPPAFLLDRLRMTRYADNVERFDNRYLARIPSAQALTARNIRNVLYVVGAHTDLPEADDLNDPFMEYSRAGITVQALGLNAFTYANDLAFYGPTEPSQDHFWSYYRLKDDAPTPQTQWTGDHRTALYAPSARTTDFSRGQRPTNFAQTSVAISRENNHVLGAEFDRNGSWNRVSSSWGGG